METVSRRHSRIKRHETVFVCAGVGAMHFFASGQKPLVSSRFGSERDAPLSMGEIPATVDTDKDEAYVSLDESDDDQTVAAATMHDSFRIDRWQVCDVSPQGLLLAQDGEPNVKFRVGDVLGIQRANAVDQWSVGIVRWFKAQEKRGIEAGVELIAPDLAPASLQTMAELKTSIPIPVLSLPAVEAARRPASLLVPRGALQGGKYFYLAGTDRVTRHVRILDTLERTGSVEQIIVGDVLE